MQGKVKNTTKPRNLSDCRRVAYQCFLTTHNPACKRVRNCIDVRALGDWHRFRMAARRF